MLGGLIVIDLLMLWMYDIMILDCYRLLGALNVLQALGSLECNAGA